MNSVDGAEFEAGQALLSHGRHWHLRAAALRRDRLSVMADVTATDGMTAKQRRLAKRAAARAAANDGTPAAAAVPAPASAAPSSDASGSMTAKGPSSDASDGMTAKQRRQALIDGFRNHR